MLRGTMESTTPGSADKGTIGFLGPVADTEADEDLGQLSAYDHLPAW